MNDADVAKQVQQMVHFIRQEAEEKASEIAVSAEEEFNIHKLQLVEAEKRKIKQEYERKEKQVEVRRKIEYSMQLNQARLKVLQAQDDIVQSLKGTVEKHLQDVSSDHEHYAHLVTQLIVQGLIRLKEPSVLLRCREADLHLVESVVEAAKGQYAEKLQTHPPEIAIDHKIYLSAGPKCAGGVVLASKDGKIVLENTLDARLEIVFKNQLPEVRKRLFRSTTLSGA